MLDLIRQRAQSWGVKIIFGIIIIVFVAWGVGSYQETGPSSVATVNGKPILMQDFQRELHAQEESFRAMVPDISPEDMRAMQLPQQVLSLMINHSLVEQEAKRLGITVTPREYADVVRKQPFFQGADGKFSQDAYLRFVAAQGKSVADYEQGMMREMLLSKMQDYVTSAIAVEPQEARRRAEFDLEQRVISYVLFSTDDYRQGVEISEDAIKTYYDANQAQFAQPAKVAISYISVTPASLAASIDVPDQEVEAAFAKGPLRYNLREVLLPVPEGTDKAAEDAMRAKLEAVAADLRQGKDFSEATAALVQEYPDAQAGDSGMMDARRIPEELLGSVAGLKKDDVASVIKMEHMLVLTQLLGSDPDWSLPEDEIKAALRKDLAEDKAALTFRDVQAQVEDMVALGKPLAEIAAEIKLEARTSNLVPREELVSVLGLRKPGQVSLFDGAKGSLVNAVLETSDGFVVAEITDTVPAGVQPLAEVSPPIRASLIVQEAEKKAEEAARAVIPQLTQGIPADYKDKVIMSEPFGRQGDIPELGFAKSLSDAVFSAPLDVWLTEPYATPKGAVIAMPVEIVRLSDENWTKIKSRYEEIILQGKQTQIMNVFLGSLHDKAEITITDSRLFE